MVREAAARLYDVNEHTVVLEKLGEAGRYDTGTITFQVRPDNQIDLDRLHESLWATRLSRGTRSGLISLEVTVLGEVVAEGQETVLKVAGADGRFELGRHEGDEHRAAFGKLQEAVERGERVVGVTGQLDGWAGRWPDVLRQPPPRRVLVIGFETAKEPQ